MNNTLLTVKGIFTWQQLGPVLGRPVYPKAYENKPEYPCGLSGGKISYKIYVGDSGSSDGSAHVCLHKDGICFSPSLNVEEDWALARVLRANVLDYHERRESTKERVNDNNTN